MLQKFKRNKGPVIEKIGFNEFGGKKEQMFLWLKIDYKRAFDSIPYSWIEKCLNIFGIGRNFQKFMNPLMKFG